MEMQHAAQKGTMVRRLGTAVVAAATMVSVQAHAALPTEATTAFTQLKADAESLITAAWPVVAAITVGFVLISLFKRAAGKV
jgi:hypothetical protein